MTTGDDGAESEELDIGVVLYSCSFAVIFLMILSQVMGWRYGQEWAEVLAAPLACKLCRQLFPTR